MAFGAKDVRLEKRGEALLERIVETGSLVLRKVGGGRGGEGGGRASCAAASSSAWAAFSAAV